MRRPASVWPRAAVRLFEGFQDDAERKYRRMVKGMKPDLEHYARHKAALGDAAFPPASSVVHTDLVKLEPARVEVLVTTLKQQEDIRKKSHKRKRFDPNADVDYINERNAKFNAKISRAFDIYTRDVKANLERGTAL